MLTRKLAEQRRPTALTERGTRQNSPAPRKAEFAARNSDKAPAYLPEMNRADLVFEPLYVSAEPGRFATVNPLLGTPLEQLGPRTDQLTSGGSRPTRLAPAYCTIPDETASLYGNLDGPMTEGPERTLARRPIPKPGEKAREDGTAEDQGKGGKDAKDGEKEKEEKQNEGGAKGKEDAAGGKGKEEATEDKSPGEEGGKGNKAGKPARRKASDDAPTGPKVVEIPRPETEVVPLSREPALRTEPAPTFTTPEAPAFTVPRGKTPEPPSRDQARAILLFAEAMRAARQLHEELVADAAVAARRVQSTADRLADLRQRDLDHTVGTLASGLQQSRTRLDERADTALELVEQKAKQTNAMIWGLAAYAFAQLASAKSDADGTYNTHDANKEKAKGEGNRQIVTVMLSGLFAGFSILNLDNTKATDNPINVDPLPSAQNEKINMHLGMTANRQAKPYFEESTAEIDSLSATFTAMYDGLKKQFAEVTKAMTKTATDSDANIAKARNGALKQLRSSLEHLRNFIAEARASGHAALVQQHNLSRRQLIVSFRERGRAESQAAQQRLMRGTSSSLALATAQQSGARSLAENLGRERSRPPADFAKVIISSTSSFTRNIGRTRVDQRSRVVRSAEAAEPPAIRQADATSTRSAASADEIVQRLLNAGETSSQATDTQVEKQLEPFPKIPKVITDALKGTLKPAIKAYDSQNKFAGDNVVLANETITNAMSGKGGGSADNKNNAAKPPEAKKDAKPACEIPNDFIARADGIRKKPKTDVGVASYLTNTRKTIIEKVTGKAQRLNSALRAFSTPIEAVMAELRAITALQGAAITDHYDHTYKGRGLVHDLRKELRKTFSATSTNNYNISAALAYLRGDHKAGALQEMKAAVNFSNDEGRVERVQRSLTPTELEELNRDHKDEMEDIVSDLGGNEEEAARALNTIKGEQKGETEGDRGKREEANIKALGLANAYGLQTEIDRSRKKKGEAGGDATAEMLATKHQSIGSDVLSGGDPMGAAFVDPDVAEKRRKALWQATNLKFEEVVKTLPDGTPNVAKKEDRPGLGAIARYAAAKREYTEYVPNKSGHGFHVEKTTAGLDHHQTELIDAIAEHGPDSEQAAAATVMFELNRTGGKPREDKLRTALGSTLGAREGESDAARARRENDEYKDGKLVRKGERTLAKERQDKIFSKIGELDARAKARAKPGGEGAKGETPPPKPPGEVKQQILSTLDVKLALDPTARAYTRSMVENLDPDPKTAFSFALAHKERNKETLIAATSRMNRDEIDKAVEEWDRDNPGESLYERLGLYETGKGKLEGDARNEVEIKFIGVPRNDRERAEVAHMSSKQVVRDSRNTAGRTMAGEEYRRLVENQGRLLEIMGVKEEDIDARGRIKIDRKSGKPLQGNFDKDGNLRITSEDQRSEFEMVMQMSSLNAESYNQAVDRIAMGITMALMIIAAVVTTFITAGGAAAIWGPILVTALAGFAGIGFTQALKGDRYTSAELQRDLVMTFVQAATAGLGAYAGAVLKGGGAVAKAAATTSKVGEAATAVPKLSMGMKALNLGKEVVIDSAIGGTTNAINSAAGAYMDPENRRLGKSGEKAQQSGLKGFLGGAVGNALTKPMGNLGKMRGGALGERMAGNVASGFTTRLAESRAGQALGDPHQSWAESLEVAKEGLGQDIVQSVGEHRAHKAGERRATRREAARQARAEAHPQPPAETGGTPTRRPQDEPARPIPPTSAPEPLLPPARPTVPEVSMPPPPPKPAGPQHTPESMARAAEVRAALPPDARPVIDQVIPVKPPVPDPAMSPMDLRPRTTTETSQPSAKEVESKPAKPSRPDAEQEPHTRKPVPGKETLEGDRNGRILVRTTDDDVLDGPSVIIAGDLPAPIHAKVALAETNMARMGRIQEDSFIIHPDSTNLHAANDNFGTLVNADPTREAAIFRNPTTGEFVVVQGGPRSTGAIRPDGGFDGINVDMPVTVNGVPKPGGHWVLHTHYHPNRPGEAATNMNRRLPSGQGGDFTIILREVQQLGHKERTSRIYFVDNGKLSYTDFGFDPKGTKGPLFVDFPDPVTGARTRKEFRDIDDYHDFRGTIKGESDVTTGPTTVRTADKGDANLDPTRRVGGETPGLGDRLTPSNLEDISAVVRHMGRVSDFDDQIAGRKPSGDRDPTTYRAASLNDAMDAVKRMGLVDAPGSMVRLNAVLNDPNVPEVAKPLVARAVLEATRQTMERDGRLVPGDELMMFFRGASPERLDDYRRGGIDPSLAVTREEDVGPGLYMSQDYASAKKYGAGANVLPFIARRSELGDVLDIRPGSPLRSRWEQFVVDNAARLRIEGVTASMLGRPGPVDYREFGAFWFPKAGRVILYDEFRRTLLADPNLDPATRAAAMNPDIVLTDLGGPVTYGNDLGFMTDQAAMKSRRVADLMNAQLGFPRVGGSEDHPSGRVLVRTDDDEPTRLKNASRSDKKKTEADTPPKTKTPNKPRQPKPAPAEGETAPPDTAPAPTEGIAPTEGEAAPGKKSARAEKAQGKRVASAADASRTRKQEQREIARGKALGEQAENEENRRRGADILRGDALKDQPAATPKALEAIRDLEREFPIYPGEQNQRQNADAWNERVDALRLGILKNRGLSPATRKYLKWQQKLWEFSLDQAEINLTVKVGKGQQKEFVTAHQAKLARDVDVPKASAAALAANRSVKEMMEQRGPNFRAKARDATFDEVMENTAFQEMRKKGKEPSSLSPDHLIPLTVISNLPELSPIFEIIPTLPHHLKSAVIKELIALGDIDENLVPLLRQVNVKIKNGRSWNDIQNDPRLLEFYTPKQIQDMVIREDAMLVEIRKKVAEMVGRYLAGSRIREPETWINRYADLFSKAEMKALLEEFRATLAGKKK